MDHENAVQKQAVERYLLGQMAAEERNSFEEHYFQCLECARDVRDAARFRANAREVLEKPEPVAIQPRKPWWGMPSLLPLAASIVLMGAVVYQAAFQIPQLRQAAAGEAATAFVPYVLHEITRGGEGITRLPRGSGAVSVYFDIPGERTATVYPCTIADASGKVVAALTVTLPKSDESGHILLRPDRFAPGTYTISLGAPLNVLARYTFEVE